MPNDELVQGDVFKALNHLIRHGWVPLNLLAPLLDLSEQTIYLKARANKIPFVKVGRDKRVSVSTVLSLLEEYYKNPRHHEHIEVVYDLYNTVANKANKELNHG